MLALSIPRNGDNRKIFRAKLALNLLLLLCASDKSAVVIAGFSFRIAWILLPVVAYFLPKVSIDRKSALYIIIFFFLHIMSALVSPAPLRGVAYSMWILFSYYFFFILSHKAAVILKEQTFDVIKFNGRLQIFCATVLFIGGFQDRAHFTYYEPSYMALALIPYVSTVFLFEKPKLADLAAAIIFLISSQSGNFLVVLVLVGLCKLYTVRKSRNFIPVVIIVLLFFSSIILYIYNDSDNINHQMVVDIVSNGITLDSAEAIIERGGNRIPRMFAAYEVVRHHLIWGVGPDNYASFIVDMDFSKITHNLPWLDPEGKPPTNIFIEATANAGIVAALMLIFVFVYGLRKASRIIDGRISTAVFSMILIICAMMQLDSNYLRSYLWSAMGICFAFFYPRRILIPNFRLKGNKRLTQE